MPGPIRSSDLESEVELHDPVLSEMCDEIDHVRDARHACETMVKSLVVDRLDDRSEYAFSQLESDQERQTLGDKLSSVRREIASFHIQTETLVRDHNNLVGVLDRDGCLHNR